MEDTFNVLVFGSAIMDFICYTSRLPKPGETLHGHKFETGFGGKGANQCVAAARLGAKTALIAKLGDDSFGNDYIRHLKAEHIGVEYVEKISGQSTGIAQIAVSDGGENNIIIVAGANNSLRPSDVTKAQKLLGQAKVLVCQFETPIEGTMAALREFKGVSIVNAAPALENVPAELLKLGTILCVNETEASLMAGMEEITSVSDAETAIGRLIEMGANTVILTMGRLGAVWASKETPGKCVHVRAPVVEKVVDTTGAGDAFIGALAYKLSSCPCSLGSHIEFACKVASMSVQSRGTQTSFPYAQDVLTT